MSTITTTLAEYRRREGTNRLGLWLFLISDAFLFAGMFVSPNMAGRARIFVRPKFMRS